VIFLLLNNITKISSTNRDFNLCLYTLASNCKQC